LYPQVSTTLARPPGWRRPVLSCQRLRSCRAASRAGRVQPEAAAGNQLPVLSVGRILARVSRAMTVTRRASTRQTPIHHCRVRGRYMHSVMLRRPRRQCCSMAALSNRSVRRTLETHSSCGTAAGSQPGTSQPTAYHRRAGSRSGNCRPEERKLVRPSRGQRQPGPHT